VLKLDINLLYTVINLLILYLIVKKILFKRINNIISRRQEEADAHYDRASEMQKEAEDLKLQCEKNLQEAEREKEDIVEQARQKATEEYKRIVSEADEKADEIVADAKAAAELEKARILKSAQTEVADFVTNVAEKVAGARISEEENQELYDEFLRKAGERNG